MPNVFALIGMVERYIGKRQDLYQFILEALNHSMKLLASMENPRILLPALQTSAVITFPQIRLPFYAMRTTSQNIEGNTITGAQSSAQATIVSRTITSGFLTNSTAAGYMVITSVSGMFSADEALRITGETEAEYGVQEWAYAQTTQTFCDYNTLPADFLRFLYRVINHTDTDTVIHIAPDKQWLIEHYPHRDQRGVLYDVYAEKETGMLYGAYIPHTEQTLTIYYYRKPTELSLSDSSEYNDIPAPFHYQLLCRMAAAQILADHNIMNEWEIQNTLVKIGLEQLYHYLRPTYNYIPVKRCSANSPPYRGFL